MHTLQRMQVSNMEIKFDATKHTENMTMTQLVKLRLKEMDHDKFVSTELTSGKFLGRVRRRIRLTK